MLIFNLSIVNKFLRQIKENDFSTYYCSMMHLVKKGSTNFCFFHIYKIKSRKWWIFLRIQLYNNFSNKLETINFTPYYLILLFSTKPWCTPMTILKLINYLERWGGGWGAVGSHRQPKKSPIQGTFWYILRESWCVAAADIFAQRLKKLQVAVELSRGGQFQCRKIEQNVIPIICLAFLCKFSGI